MLTNKEFRYVNAEPDKNHSITPLLKTLSGIKGLDDITYGGLPKERPTLVCGGAGTGKTLFGLEFLVRGAVHFNEPGVCLSFEESEIELTKNVASLGFDLEKLKDEKKLIIDQIIIEKNEIEETGEYNLDGLFIRIGLSIDSIGAKRVLIDTMESLFSSFNNEFILRSEIRRLFRWLKKKGVTAVITAEPGEKTFTRYGLEEYISDCVIMLDNQVTEQVATRRLRIVKYRGSKHGTNEYPFLIGKDGISIFPITSVGLEYEVSSEKISSGVPRLDALLGGQGYYRESSILISGTAGTGKSSLAAYFAAETAKRGEKTLYLAFEESQSQIIRNMRSIGLDLEQWVKKGLLEFKIVRPTSYNLELHLAIMYEAIREFKPKSVIIDPLSSLLPISNQLQVRLMIMRIIDFLKMNHITTFLTNLVHSSGSSLEETEIAISSLIDTWLLVKVIELNGECNRLMYILKSRGMAHSNQVREFIITDEGIDLVDVYIGPGVVLTGAARINQEAEDKVASLVCQHDIERKKRELERKRQELEMQIYVMRSQYTAEEEELNLSIQDQGTILSKREKMAQYRKADRTS
ncbi:MAG: circadian clock protein KaiC [Desulfobacterales bacterium]|nr:circadian clock protein KaiC [Desulfobacterales bacterium]